MEILINELSLHAQFCDTSAFVKDALLPIKAILSVLSPKRDVIYKKTDLWQYKVSENTTLHDILKGREDEITRIKSLLADLLEGPFWDEPLKEHSTTYLYKGRDIRNSSLAESVERDRLVISFWSDEFSTPQLPVVKEQQTFAVENLLNEKQTIELFYTKEILPYSDYFAWKFFHHEKSLVENKERFTKTNKIEQGQSVYQESATKHLWYLDNLHKDHYEVFDSQGYHIGTACLKGCIDKSRKDKNKTIKP